MKLHSKILIRTAKATLAVVLIGVLLMSVDLNQIISLVASMRKGWLLVCVLVAFFVFDFQAILLGIIASPFAKIPHLKLLSLTLIGRFFSLFLPSSLGGDVIKGLYLFPYFSTRTKAYAAIVVHRAVGGISTLAVALIACLMFLPDNFPVVVACMILSICGFAGAVILLIWGAKIKVLLYRNRERFSRYQFVKTVYSMISAIAAYRHQRVTLLFAFVLSAMGTILSVGLYMIVAYTLRIPLTAEQALVAASATMLSVLIPLTPGGVGVGESAFVIFAGMMGVQAENALAIVLCGRLLGYVCSLPGGILYLFLPSAAVPAGGAPLPGKKNRNVL